MPNLWPCHRRRCQAWSHAAAAPMHASPTHDVQAAAGHLTAAAHHLAAAGDRAAYWALLAHVERLVGVPEAAQDFAELAAGYAAGVLTFPEACRGAQVSLAEG